MNAKNMIKRLESWKDEFVTIGGPEPHGSYIVDVVETEKSISLIWASTLCMNSFCTTVHDLIHALEGCAPEKEVCISGSKKLLPVLFICGDNQGNIWLETEDDTDMTEEIKARFDAAIEEGIDELDIYSEMLECGITVDMVRKYLDDEAACHMEAFCQEHGLL